jgi:hypothetical protein
LSWHIVESLLYPLEDLHLLELTISALGICTNAADTIVTLG